MVRILFVGDVIGRPGRRAVRELLPQLEEQHLIDYTIVNVENSAGGFGVTPAVLREFEDLEIDCYTTGNHIWDKRDGVALLDQPEWRLLRPANYPSANPGVGLHVGQTASGVPIATLNLEGQVFMKGLRSPFEAADELLSGLRESHPELRIVVVDFHAEATSEKQAMAFHLDGRVAAVLGTHTHVPTADACVLPGGTAFQCDVGMSGPYESIIGRDIKRVMQTTRSFEPTHFHVATRDVRLCGALIECDENGRAKSIERFEKRIESK